MLLVFFFMIFHFFRRFMLLHFLMTHFLGFSNLHASLWKTRNRFFSFHYASCEWLFVLWARICATRETDFIFIPISHRSRVRNLQENDKLVDQFAIVLGRDGLWFNAACGQRDLKRWNFNCDIAPSENCISPWPELHCESCDAIS